MKKSRKPVTAWLVVTESGTILGAERTKLNAQRFYEFAVSDWLKDSCSVRIVKVVEVVGRGKK